ncbi:hypothetical protein ACMFY5_02720, partial [Pseudomonas sihuiensis]
VHQLLEGTNELMRLIVARRLLLQGGMLDRLLLPFSPLPPLLSLGWG